jgi:hypothetical protein
MNGAKVSSRLRPIVGDSLAPHSVVGAEPEEQKTLGQPYYGYMGS